MRIKAVPFGGWWEERQNASLRVGRIMPLSSLKSGKYFPLALEELFLVTE
jgi:hypothetical protein